MSKQPPVAKDVAPLSKEREGEKEALTAPAAGGAEIVEADETTVANQEKTNSKKG